jgi:5-formyltetrahydrofolate cyclo-ligase
MDELRRKAAERLKRLSPLEIASRSSLAVENLADWLAKNASPDSVVGLFRPPEENVWGEANPYSLISHPGLAEYHFAFPRVIDRIDRGMDFAIPIAESDWAKGVYGNPEPWTDLPSVDPLDLEVIVVPGLVFGSLGERIGRGAGYYDRFLASAPASIRIGFGYDFQLESGPVLQAEWDARMDFVATDLRLVETRIRPLN